jgi:hypothetical protein
MFEMEYFERLTSLARKPTLRGHFYVLPPAINTTTRIKCSHIISVERRCYLFLLVVTGSNSGQTMSNRKGFVNARLTTWFM